MRAMLLTHPIPLDLPELRTSVDPDHPATLLVELDHPVAEQLARAEAEVFPEAPDLFGSASSSGMFHFLVIALDSHARHVVRLSGPRLLGGRSNRAPFFLTDLLDSDPSLTLGEIDRYYRTTDIDIDRTISVETHFRIGEHLEPLRSADLVYLSLLDLLTRTGGDAALAHVNAATIKSFTRVGVDWHPFAGRIDLRTPTVGADGNRSVDENYFPVCVPRGTNAALLKQLVPFTPPLVVL